MGRLLRNPVRTGQSSVELMLLISVFVVGIVAAGYALVPSIRAGFVTMSQGASEAYVEPSRAP